MSLAVNTPPYNALVPARKTPPEAWVDAGLTALAEGGPDAIRIEALAASLGVDNFTNAKYYLYHPFPQSTYVADFKLNF